MEAKRPEIIKFYLYIFLSLVIYLTIRESLRLILVNLKQINNDDS